MLAEIFEKLGWVICTNKMPHIITFNSRNFPYLLFFFLLTRLRYNIINSWKQWIDNNWIQIKITHRTVDSMVFVVLIATLIIIIKWIITTRGKKRLLVILGSLTRGSSYKKTVFFLFIAMFDKNCNLCLFLIPSLKDNYCWLDGYQSLSRPLWN